jgi:hypothetical protein
MSNSTRYLGNESLYQPCHDLTKKAVWEHVAKKNRVNEGSIKNDPQCLSCYLSANQNSQIPEQYTEF